MKFPKQKRIVNKELLATYRTMACAACGGRNEVAGHHLDSRGSGGHDVRTNLCPLCVTCHQRVHSLGEYAMRVLHPRFDSYLNYIGREWKKRK